MGRKQKRYCAMGAKCYHVVHLRSPEPVSLQPSHKGDICDKCRDAGYRPEYVPDEYEQLFRAAQMLFAEGITDEEVIISTFAFAACSWETPRLRHIRDQFVATEEGSEARKQLENEFFNTFRTLGVERVVNGVLLVRTRPLVVLAHVNDETGLVERITVDVYPRSLDEVKPHEGAEHYEKVLLRHSIAQDWRMGCVSHSVLTGRIRIMTEPKDNLQINTLGIHIISLPPKQQPAFPHKDEIQSKYDFIVRAAKESGVGGLAGRERGVSFQPYNLIPACTAWYVGKRGQFVGQPSL